MHINGKSHLKCIHEVSWIGAIEIIWKEAFTGWNDGAGMQKSINLGRRYPAPYSMFYLSLLAKIALLNKYYLKNRTRTINITMELKIYGGDVNAYMQPSTSTKNIKSYRTSDM